MCENILKLVHYLNSHINILTYKKQHHSYSSHVNNVPLFFAFTSAWLFFYLIYKKTEIYICLI